MPEPVIVRHALGSYPVLVDPGILQQLDVVVRERLPGRRIAMISDDTVHALYQAGSLGRVSWTGETLTVPPGEGSKTRESWARLTDELLGRQFGRDSGLIGLGGGMVGDLTGFVAATYMRGLSYILAPTTLLAMLDASVGGKTGVNAPQGKNLIGAFHPPAAVVADPGALMTLPEREYRSGLAEAVKHGLIADASYFEWMEHHSAALVRREPEPLARLVRRSVEIKAHVVSEDERESGRRAILNAGHTVAHALEQASQYRLTHGEAVALGLLVECAVAERMELAPSGLGARVRRLSGQLGLPTSLPHGLNRTSLLEHMSMDKKNRGREIHFALVRSLGEMHRPNGWTTPVDRDLIGAVLKVIE
jgi:3-dehydroquinate synthase